MDIDNMEAGPEMDRLIADKVMGLKEGIDFGTFPEHDLCTFESDEGDVVHSCNRCFWDDTMEPEPCYVEPDNYSTLITMAWQVIEHTGLLNDKALYMERDPWAKEAMWRVGEQGWDRLDWIAEGDTAPLAICKAALKAVDNSPIDT